MKPDIFKDLKRYRASEHWADVEAGYDEDAGQDGASIDFYVTPPTRRDCWLLGVEHGRRLFGGIPGGWKPNVNPASEPLKFLALAVNAALNGQSQEITQNTMALRPLRDGEIPVWDAEPGHEDDDNVVKPVSFMGTEDLHRPNPIGTFEGNRGPIQYHLWPFVPKGSRFCVRYIVTQKDRGAGMTTEFHVSEVNPYELISGKVDAPDPDEEPGAGASWTREQRLNVRGPQPGGWLKHGVGSSGDVRYWPGPLYLGLRPDQRLKVREQIRDSGATHVPIILRVGADIRLPFQPMAKFDGTLELARTIRLLREIVATGAQPILFGCDGDTSIRSGITRAQVMAGLRLVYEAAGPELVGSVCPGIEMNEWGGRSDWEAMSAQWPYSKACPIWSHFTPEMYWEPLGYDGILWQDKDIGHDGVTVRSPEVRYSYLMNAHVRDYHDDRYFGSPARSAKRNGLAFCYFEYAVPGRLDDTFASRVADNARRALRDLDMLEAIG